MGISEREYHIKVLEQFFHDYKEWGEDLELGKTIEYAISFLKTDEVYQLIYEGEEIYTKDDMVAILEELRTQMEKYEPKWAENDEQAVASCRTWEDLDDIIQQKIDKLKENTDGNK